MAREIRRKYYLKNVAGTSKQFDDFENFRKQRDTVKRLCILAREAYFRNSPTEENNWLPRMAIEAAQTLHSCDNCDRDFFSEQVNILNKKIWQLHTE